ncbi:hypothetical protein B0T16DRAFT_401475 [Cercophora newfieldiana]|uniref:C6 transcription factor RegA n=1 Tax=Cercophora newfieldiana TaxID=92897 RepID=A0AA39YRI7_9PEZI|nr:hypothetical protein B0T16DRAFT_401475 [Cercophora newfieldiana]
MASPIGNLIHHNPESRSEPHSQPPLPPPHPHPPPPGIPAYPTSGFDLAPLSTAPSVGSHVPLDDAAAAPLGAPQKPKGHANTQSLYQCAECLRRYSRPEHLQRHIATHTLGKRFTCDICSKAFSRADLLKRHRTNHQDDNGAKRRRVITSPGASRVAHACLGCAKARVKCEEMKPCTRCQNRGIKCEYASPEDAAMHLLHLSAANSRAIDQQNSSPESAYSQSQSAAGHNSQHQLSSTVSPTSFHHTSSASTATQTPVLPGHPPLAEGHLPTPDAMMDQCNPHGYQTPYPYPGAGMEEMGRLPFSDFLRDVLYDQPLADPNRLTEPQGLAVLNFCDDANLELKEIDFGILNDWNVQSSLGVSNMQQHQPDEAVNISAIRSRLVKIFAESPWRWTPRKSDTGYTEQSNMSLPSGDASVQDGGRKTDRVIKEKLHSSSRDKILAIILGRCRENSVRAKVASSFPSAEIMDSWIHIFLASQLCQVSAWIHYGSFSLNEQCPEWLAIAASAGAIHTPLPTLRRFGFALQEAVRLSIPDRFEENNTKIADIGLVQALMLVQDVGLWSGNRRKMEIAECHLQIPIAMMRYRGKFQRSAHPHVVIDPSDEGEVLEEKWRTWYEMESWKRLVFHAYLRDSQVSMTQFCNQSMSYAELTLPLPCSKELWFARTAEEFKIRYLEARVTEGKRAPSLVDLLRDVNLLSTNHYQLDVQFAISVYLHGFWSLIWDFRQSNSVFRLTDHSPGLGGGNLILNSRRQELERLLHNFQLVTFDWHEMLSAQETMVLHLLLMNLNVSLDDLQLFSGKEGEVQARRIYPTLRTWSESPEARQALWHAGQILRQGKLFPPGHLKDFYAVAVHHAALCLWTHSVVTRAALPQGQHQYPHHQQQQQNPLGYGGEEMVFLDGEGAPHAPAHVHRWLTFGQGRAAIRGPDNTMRNAVASPPVVALLSDPRCCMEVAQEVLKANFVEGQESLPPISENIMSLLRQLGNAAWAVGLG